MQETSASYPSTNQAYEYPEDTLLDQLAEDDKIEELVDFLQENLESNTQKAGEQLFHSQKLMKQQLDKNLNPIVSSKLEIGDNVLIVNVYRGKLGGKLQDKWIGPHPVTKVNSTSVNILRNKTTQRVNRSNVKLFKSPHPTTNTDATRSKYQRLKTKSDDNNKQEISDENFLFPSSPFTGTKSQRLKPSYKEIT